MNDKGGGREEAVREISDAAAGLTLVNESREEGASAGRNSGCNAALRKSRTGLMGASEQRLPVGGVLC